MHDAAAHAHNKTFIKGQHKPKIPVIKAEHFKSWMQRNGEKPSELVAAWFKALSKARGETKNGSRKEQVRATTRQIIDEIEQRAKAADEPFDRNRMPGRVKDFLDSFQRRDSCLFIGAETFKDYKKGICNFVGGSKETDFYRRLFPELYDK